MTKQCLYCGFKRTVVTHKNKKIYRCLNCGQYFTIGECKDAKSRK